MGKQQRSNKKINILKKKSVLFFNNTDSDEKSMSIPKYITIDLDFKRKRETSINKEIENLEISNTAKSINKLEEMSNYIENLNIKNVELLK